MSSRLSQRTWILLIIFAALAAWGVLHALGGFLGGVNAPPNIRLAHDWRRAAVVAACVVLFLGGWAALLARRRR